jgi:hypothetical protein
MSCKNVRKCQCIAAERKVKTETYNTGQECTVEEHTPRHGRELGELPLVERVSDEACRPDGEHGDERVVLEAVVGAAVEGEGEEELVSAKKKEDGRKGRRGR